jgi:HAD superfamily hydrolase (TIGR01509 family)
VDNKQAIIFDLEGVVIDSEPIWDQINTEFLTKRNINPDVHQIKIHTMGKTMEEAIAIMMQMYNFKGKLKDLVKERRDIAERLLRSEISFIPGFKGFFKKIKPSYKVAVATSMERLFFRDVDDRLKLTRLFEGHIYSIEDIGFVAKPKPDIFLHAAIKLSVEPKACIVIEDSPNGVRAAKSADMYCIALTTSTSKEKLANADEIAVAYSEINI